MTASFAVLGTACAAGDYEEVEGEGSVESIEQAVVLPQTGLQLKISVDNGFATGDVYAFITLIDDAPPAPIPLNYGDEWPTGETQTVGIALPNPEDVKDVYIQYGNGQNGDHNEYWTTTRVQVHDVRNAALSTMRADLRHPLFFSPNTAFYDREIVPIPNVLLRAQNPNLGNRLESFYISYQTWNGGRYCVSIRNDAFTHAPLGGSGCDWANSHDEAYMDYVSWDGYNWRATVNTNHNVMSFTHHRKSGPTPIAAPHSSANLRYKASNGQHWELHLKPWDIDN